MVFVKRGPVKGDGVADEEDLAGLGAGGQFGGEGFAFRFVVGEADFDQAVVGEGLVEGGGQRVGDAIVSEMDDGPEFLGAGFELAQGGFGLVHAKKGLLAFSWATVVRGPWPGKRMVSPGRLRISRRMLSRVAV